MKLGDPGPKLANVHAAIRASLRGAVFHAALSRMEVPRFNRVGPVPRRPVSTLPT